MEENSIAFSCSHSSWCRCQTFRKNYYSKPLEEEKSSIPFPFHIFIPLAKFWFHPPSRKILVERTSTCSSTLRENYWRLNWEMKSRTRNNNVDCFERACAQFLYWNTYFWFLPKIGRFRVLFDLLRENGHKFAEFHYEKLIAYLIT